MVEKVLVIAAHPDDEVLGCGGTMARHADAGDTVRVLVMAEGIASRHDGKTEAVSTEQAALRECARAANAALGVEDVIFHSFPDNAMDGVSRLEVIKTVEAAVSAFDPDVVYTHHAGDVNVDHRRIHEAVVTALRPVPGKKAPLLMFFEVASSTEWQTPGSAPAFVPNWFVDVTLTLDRKKTALDCYAFEMRDWPHARSVKAVEHLARWRGATAGREAAEAFMLGRRIE